ncbi:hypothetical protein TTHERM_00297100 (macronuclear) [Tetrahymena thermophila SB210]|uniref:Uncharacterized protein n=1 Tax=Tetrahymena thermophila (strain SB210) TaxID=312017 RepID=I7MDZ3_TETTS|nr:hypothetical protein TTHERM_00297100 [Tetrahymena thermophila SB210]EAR92998.1 hypothetical protein TTHERM_00297100 [Tetrahymena thermophila SB210]|eukprot:XP_001013243.1 hypothetical protein TTHERM_00297100 [Tetrahymena thermophila SB210]
MSLKNQQSNRDCNEEISILKSNCFSIDDDIEKKVKQARNLLRQTALSLQKIAESSKIDISHSQNFIESTQTPQRKISINIHQKMTKNKNSALEGKEYSQVVSDLISFKSIAGQSDKQFDLKAPIKEYDNARQNSSQDQSLTDDAFSSKCSIMIDFKNQENSKNKQDNNIECEKFVIDNQNDLEKRIHKWLDDQGIIMVNPSQNRQEYFDSKRSQVLIMCKKLNFYKNCSSITQSQLSCKETLYINSQSSDKLLTQSCSTSPQKMHNGLEVQNKSEFKIEQHINKIQQSNFKNSGSDIIISSLFNNSINDSPLMQRRKILMQRDQQRNISCDNSQEKKSNFDDKSKVRQILQLSQYKRSTPSKQNIESITDILNDCK